MQARLALFLLAALAIVLVPSTTYGQNLVTNGDFATGDLSGWEVTGSNIKYEDGRCLLGTVGEIGSVQQNLTTASGSLYQLTFTVSSGGGESTNTFSASLGTSVLVALDAPGAFSDVTCSYCYSATETTTSLTFAARNDPSFWNIDDVSVELDPTCTQAAAGPCAGNVSPSTSPSPSASPSPSPSAVSPLPSSLPSGASQLKAWWMLAQ